MKNFKKLLVNIFNLIFIFGNLLNAAALTSTNASSGDGPTIYIWSPSEGWKEKYPTNISKSDYPSITESIEENVDSAPLQQNI